MVGRHRAFDQMQGVVAEGEGMHRGQGLSLDACNNLTWSEQECDLQGVKPCPYSIVEEIPRKLC